MSIAAAGLQVVVGEHDLTSSLEQLTFSAADPGGFQTCSLSLPDDAARVARGSDIRICDGLETAWEGRVAEVQETGQGSKATLRVSGEGHGGLLKDNPFSMVYVDQDLKNWREPSTQRKLDLVAGSYMTTGAQATPDTATGAPSLETAVRDTWLVTSRPISEPWYDAGEGNGIGSIYYAVKKNDKVSAADANWATIVGLADTDAAASYTSSGDIHGTGYPQTGTLTAVGTRRHAFVQFFYEIAGGVAGDLYALYWTVLAVYGDHGLPKRGTASATASQGFYPSDVVRHAVSRAKGIAPGVIEEATGFILPHSVYREPAMPEAIIGDMAGLMGWHWGVWEAPTFGGLPRLDFRPPPPEATAVVSLADCENHDIAQKLADLYDSAQVTYADPSGSQGRVTVTRPNPTLAEEAGVSRTLTLNMGQGTALTAQQFGAFALALAEQSARGAGSLTLPSHVLLPGGGSKAAHLLRPGIDRIRVLDLPESGSLTDTDTRRRDTFRIVRAETTVERNGVLRTAVELDSGANLLDVLIARMEATAVLLG